MGDQERETISQIVRDEIGPLAHSATKAAGTAAKILWAIIAIIATTAFSAGVKITNYENKFIALDRRIDDCDKNGTAKHNEYVQKREATDEQHRKVVSSLTAAVASLTSSVNDLKSEVTYLRSRK